MVEIKKAEQSRCCNCCSSKQDVYNVTFWKDGTNSGTQVALCKKCMDEFGKLARLIEPEDNKNDGDSDDLISRKDAISALKALEESAPTAQHVSAIFDCEDTIRDLPSAEPERKWIPVSEALPENTEFVLLTIRRLDKSYNQTPFISVGYVSWNQNAWWCAHDGDCDAHNVEVLAWMPLVEPWRGE